MARSLGRIRVDKYGRPKVSFNKDSYTKRTITSTKKSTKK